MGRGVQVTGRRHCAAELQVGDSWLDHYPFVLDIHGQDRAHSAESDHDPVGDGEGATGEPGAATAGYERDVALVAQTDQGRNLRRGGWQHHSEGQRPPASETVALVGAQLVGLGEHPVRPHDRPQITEGARSKFEGR